MAERGQIGGLDFRMSFPEQQVGQVPVQPVGVAPQQIAPLENDPLAVREGLTADYYNNYGLLKAFVTDMARKGIDPFQFDYTQEGGGLPFQTAQKLQAGVLYAANALKNEMTAENQMRPLLAQGATMMAPKVDRPGLFASDSNSYVPTKLLPGVEELNQRLAQETNDPQSQVRVNALIQPQLDRLQQLVTNGQISQAAADFQGRQIVANAWRTQPFAPRSSVSGLKQEDILGRAELIKKIKSGIITNDNTGINMLKLVPGVEDVSYVNTGDQVGLEVWMRGQSQPAFVDLSQAGGEGDINALLNRIEGQKNVPNEAVFQFDTKVNIPSSNVGQVISGVKEGAKQFSPEVVSKLQELAAQRKLYTSDGAPIASVEVDGPNMGWLFGGFGKTELKVKKFKVGSNGKVDYSKTTEEYISDPAQIEALIQSNANTIAPAFGGGFVTNQSAATSGKTIKRSDIPSKAAASNRSVEEYTQLLKERGIQIVD